MGVLKDDHLTYHPETWAVSGWYVKWSSFKTPILAGPKYAPSDDLFRVSSNRVEHNYDEGSNYGQKHPKTL